jgi:hypothetical protein
MDIPDDTIRRIICIMRLHGKRTERKLLYELLDDREKELLNRLQHYMKERRKLILISNLLNWKDVKNL